MDIQAIKRMLNENAEQVVRHLLPAGRLVGREWEVGSIMGEPGRSLKVCIAGSKVGVWSDFQAGIGGDLLDLWREVRGLSGNAEALAEVRGYFGIADPKLEPVRRKTYRRPFHPCKDQRQQGLSEAVMRYLTGQRKLSREAIAAYRITEVQQIGPWPGWKRQQPAQGPWIVFPSYRDGELLGVKYLHLQRRDGKKLTMVEPGCEPTCFGWHAIDPKAREIVICEGELDAVSLSMYGWPAVSVPFGGGSGAKQQWVDHDWDILERFETIYLCMDNDDAGRAATAELIQRLGMHRCRIVTLPYKDANECLQRGVSPDVIRQCFTESRCMEPEELRRASDYADEVVREFYPPGGKAPGFDPPWARIPFRFLRGEVTVITGINGHGKSLLWGQVLLSAITQGERVCVASMEMHPKKTLYRLVRQATGQKSPSASTITKCLDWLGESMWLFSLVGTAKIERLMQVFEFGHKRYGIRQFLIDSLMKCGIAEDDYQRQKAFVEGLCDFAGRTGAHVYLIAHARKGDDELTPAGKMDVKGTGAITDLAFNFFSVHRNKRKEQILKAHYEGIPCELPRGKTLDQVRMEPDALLICDKSRNVDGAEGKYPLWFDPASLQFRDQRDIQPPSCFMAGKEEESAPF